MGRGEWAVVFSSSHGKRFFGSFPSNTSQTSLLEGSVSYTSQRSSNG